MAPMVTALLLVSAAALLDKGYCTGYKWQPFGQRPPDNPPPPPPPPEQKPRCTCENAPKGGGPKKREDESTKHDKKDGGANTDGGTTTIEPVVGFPPTPYSGFPPSPFSGFPPSQKVPIPPAFYQGLKGGPLAGFQIQPVPGKGAIPIAVLADFGPTGPPVPPPKGYPVLSKGGVLKGWRAAPLARPIVLQQIPVPNVRVKSKSFQYVSPKGVIVDQSSPSVWNVSSKGPLSYIAV